MTFTCLTYGKRSRKYCSMCEVARYCSKECQLDHWNLEHKFTCKVPELEAAGAAEGEQTLRMPPMRGYLARLAHQDMWYSTILMDKVEGKSKAEIMEFAEDHPSRQVCKMWDRLQASKDSTLLIYRQRQIVVPKRARVNLIHVAHRRHKGFWPIKEHLCSRYWWEEIEEEVSRVLRACKVCFEGYNIKDID